MASTLLAQDNLLPRPAGGLGPGAVLALLVHVALVVALTAAVDWRSAPTEVVSAELWSAVPQVAAPRAVEPPAPPPAPAPRPQPATPPAPSVEAPLPDAQIAIERAKRAAAEREQAARERIERQKVAREAAAEAARQREAEQRDKLAKAQAAKEAAEKAAEQAEAKQVEARKAEAQRLAEQREANLRRMLGQAGATGSPTATGTAARDGAPSASYVGRLVASIKPNIVFADSVPGNPAAEVEVRATGTGTILSRRLLKSSGHKDWDEAVLRAIDRTGTLPRDTDGRVPSAIVITFRPQE